MSKPAYQSRDDLYRRLPDGIYELVPGVMPRAELDKALEALRKERDERKAAEQRVRGLRQLMLTLSKDDDAERVLASLREIAK